MYSYIFKQQKGKHIRQTIAVALLLDTLSANAQQQEKSQLRLTQQEISGLKAKAGNAPGSSNVSSVQEIVLAGDPSKQQLYTIVLKIPPHTTIPAHLHLDQRMGTVISGTWYFGYGNKFDKSKLKKLPVGSMYSEVKNQNHFAMTGDEPLIVELNGYGPSGVTYVDPANDPQNHK